MGLKYTWKNAINGDVQIDIFSEIDQTWGFSLANLTNQLSQTDGKNVHVRINSPGGSVVEGLAIANILNSYQGDVTVEVVGYAASIASVIVAKAKKAVMAADSFLMIHEPYVGAVGATASELSSLSDTAQMFEDTIVAAYVNSIDRRGKKKERHTEEYIRKAMKAETWFSAQDALDLGLIDEVVASFDEYQTVPVVANYDATMWNSIKEFKNIPDQLKNKFDNINTENTMNKNTLLEKLKNLVSSVDEVVEETTEATTEVVAEPIAMSADEMIAHLTANGYAVTPADEVLTAEQLEEQFNAAVDAKVEAIKAQLKADANKGKMNVPAAKAEVKNNDADNPFASVKSFLKTRM
jgi:ATP-dependent Clp endopeptidase proteolytic subunit ClpP